mmetsp:Transcript_61462/g.194543  ORF Transcript_61462/g.194543 Transcript_61462/m.194543 type:complete len:167 (+) Transcript_61462:708-1208(+)
MQMAKCPSTRLSACIPARGSRTTLSTRSRAASVRVTAMASPVSRNARPATAAQPTMKKPADGEPYVAENWLVMVEKDSVIKRQLLDELSARERIMKLQGGFVDVSVAELPDEEFLVSQTWASKEDYEKWMDCDFRMKSHLPTGVCQYKAVSRWSVPEEFLPVVGDH